MNDQQLMEIFENEYREFDRERHHKEFWAVSVFYKNKMVNELFVVFKQGYELGKA